MFFFSVRGRDEPAPSCCPVDSAGLSLPPVPPTSRPAVAGAASARRPGLDERLSDRAEHKYLKAAEDF